MIKKMFKEEEKKDSFNAPPRIGEGDIWRNKLEKVMSSKNVKFKIKWLKLAIGNFELYEI